MALRIKYNLCVDCQKPVLFVKSCCVPYRPKQFNAKITPIFQVWPEANGATIKTAAVGRPHSNKNNDGANNDNIQLDVVWKSAYFGEV